MTGRTQFILTAALSGGIALAAATGDFAAWRVRWPIDLTWATIPVMLVWPGVVAYRALWRSDAPHEQVRRACLFLLIATYLGLTSSLLLLQEALIKTR